MCACIACFSQPTHACMHRMFFLRQHTHASHVFLSQHKHALHVFLSQHEHASHVFFLSKCRHARACIHLRLISVFKYRSSGNFRLMCGEQSICWLPRVCSHELLKAFCDSTSEVYRCKFHPHIMFNLQVMKALVSLPSKCTPGIRVGPLLWSAISSDACLCFLLFTKHAFSFFPCSHREQVRKALPSTSTCSSSVSV